MRVKSYYGNTIREALDQARRELGPEASILASRHTDDSPNSYEVVCGIADDTRQREIPEDRPKPVRTSVAETREPPPPAPAPGTLNKIRSALSRVTPAVAQIKAGLLADGFTEDLTADIAAGVSQRLRQGGRKPARTVTPDEALAAELASRLRTSAQLGRTGSKRRIVALVGPPGAGKTSTLVKLAVKYGLAPPGPLRLVSADVYRIGGTDMLRAYAHGMAAQFDTAASAATLAQLIDGHTSKGLMLIDTPGLANADMPAALASLLSRHMDVDVHLVLPATLSPAAMSRAFDRFRPFLPSKIVVTSVDDVPVCRAAVAQSLLHDMPVSFIGTGQLVPEDLVPVTAARLCGASSADEAEAVSAA